MALFRKEKNFTISEMIEMEEELKSSALYTLGLNADDKDLFPRSNEPSVHACMYIWRLPRGSNTPQLAALEI